MRRILKNERDFELTAFKYERICIKVNSRRKQFMLHISHE